MNQLDTDKTVLSWPKVPFLQTFSFFWNSRVPWTLIISGNLFFGKSSSDVRHERNHTIHSHFFHWVLKSINISCTECKKIIWVGFVLGRWVWLDRSIMSICSAVERNTSLLIVFLYKFNLARDATSNKIKIYSLYKIERQRCSNQSYIETSSSPEWVSSWVRE